MGQYFDTFYETQEKINIRYTDPINLEKSIANNLKLMPHQEKAILALDKYFKLKETNENEGEKNGMLVMPTGSGKTFTAVKWLLNEGVGNGYRIVWLVHRQELISQTYRTFLEQAPCLTQYGIKKIRIIPVSGADASIVYARRGDINVVSINSIANKNGYRHIEGLLGTNGKKKLIVVIDEAHHAASPSYQKVLKRINLLSPNRILLGLTATPVRTQSADLHRLQNTFNVKENKLNNYGTRNGYAYEITLKEMIVAGVLSKPKYIRRETNIIGDVEFDMTEADEAFFERFGELSETMKLNVARSSGRNKIILQEYLDHKDQYGKTLIFAVNQLHCKTLQKEFSDAGIKCEYCISDEPGAQEVIRRFKNNEFDVLINVMILTEGSDVPDIQTVFLTRQTNSDSLLMQMIGRGLRGPRAGGTEEAFIVSFHDTWNKFNFWLEPSNVLEKEDVVVPPVEDDTETKRPDVFTPEEQMERDQTVSVATQGLTEWDLYLRIYNRMRSNIVTKSFVDVFPVGWYSVVDASGEDKKVLVFENQLTGFKQLENDSQKILSSKSSARTVLRTCFDISENLPDQSDIQLILDMLYENEEMPAYYTFIQSSYVDAASISAQMNQLFVKDDDKENWLKEMFDESPLLREMYKHFYVFKRMVFEAQKVKNEPYADIVTTREKLDIDVNRYDLDSLLDEVIAKYPFMNRETLKYIRWGHRPNKTWFGICRRYVNDDGTYECDILINPVLAASESNSEIIKFTVYHEMLHAMGIWTHSDNFRAWEWDYPNSAELQQRTNELLSFYDIDKTAAVIQPPKKPDSAEKKEEKKQEDSGSAEPVYEANTITIAQANKTIICSNCNEELPAKSRFCNMCGTKM